MNHHVVSIRIEANITYLHITPESPSITIGYIASFSLLDSESQNNDNFLTLSEMFQFNLYDDPPKSE